MIKNEFLSLDKPVLYQLTLNEYRTELYDDRLNLMGLTPPKEINYLNFDAGVSRTPDFVTYNSVVINLSNNVQI